MSVAEKENEEPVDFTHLDSWRRFDGITARVHWFFLILVALHLAYPISTWSDAWDLAYLSCYPLLLGVGIWAASVSQSHLIATSITALATLGMGVPWILLGQDIVWLTIATYISLMAFQVITIYILVSYISCEDSVSQGSVFAAMSIYIIFGNFFTAVYMIIYTLDPGAFIDTAGAAIEMDWQQMVYFSYCTLTTVGYGDILPRSTFAQSLAALEAMLGLLYIGLVIGRFAGFERKSRR